MITCVFIYCQNSKNIQNNLWNKCSLDYFSGSADPDINPNDKYRGQCGRRHPAGIGVRIQSNDPNDRVTQFGEWPHMCAVLNRTEIGGIEHSLYVGGGSLIAPNVILTAGHTVE